MPNYFEVDIVSATPASGRVRVSNSAISDWTVHGRQVDVGIAAPIDKTYTEYKIWGYGLYSTEESVSWTVLSSGTVNITLDDEESLQIICARFRDDNQSESLIVTASGITYDWINPTKQENLLWVALNDGNDQSNTLRDSVNNIDITFDKSNIKHLKFHNRDFTGFSMTSGYITCLSGSQIWKLIEYDSSAYITAEKTFPTTTKPFISLDLGDGSGFKTLTRYDGTDRSDLSGAQSGKISDFDWTEETKKLSFKINSFSTYGFCTLNKIEYTNDSVDAGYNGESIQLKVKVTDTNGEGVELAPVTFSGVSGDVIGNFSANPVNTNFEGIATATLNLTSIGSAIFEAHVDTVYTEPDQSTYCYDSNILNGTTSSLLRQYEQIRRSATYDDTVSNVNVAAVAEPITPTTSGNSDDMLEHDMNVVRTLIKDLKGSTNWFGDLGNYFDPTNTNSGDAENKDLNLTNLKNNSLDSKTILIPVEATNSGIGFTISGTMAGFLYNTNILYATVNNTRGLPIFDSVDHSGSYYDEGGSDEVCVINLIDVSTGADFVDISGDIIYAKFHDGSDFDGGGNNYDVYVRFYANNVAYTWTSSDPNNISMVFPFRKVLNEIKEYEWTRTDFVSHFEGDVAFVEDMVNLWSFTGGANDVVGPSWNNTTNYYIVDSTDSLWQAVDNINTEAGDRVYTEGNYITDGEVITASLDALDENLKDVEDSVTAGVAEKYIEELSTDISENTVHALPSNQIYTPYSVSGREGKNLNIWLNGQLLVASTGVNGINVDRDYAEVTVSGIAFHRKLHKYSNLTYLIKS